MSSAVLGTRCTQLPTMRTTANGGGGVIEKNRIEVKDHSPQIVSVALLVVSAVLGSAIFGALGAMVAPIVALWVLSVLSDGKCLDPEVTVVYRETPKANPDQGAQTPRTWNASSIHTPEFESR